MSDTHQVTGTVTDKATGSPVSATVRAYNASTGAFLGEDTTDGSGDYLITLPDDSDVIVAVPTGSAYLPAGIGPITPDPIP